MRLCKIRIKKIELREIENFETKVVIIKINAFEMPLMSKHARQRHDAAGPASSASGRKCRRAAVASAKPPAGMGSEQT